MDTVAAINDWLYGGGGSTSNHSITSLAGKINVPDLIELASNPDDRRQPRYIRILAALIRHKFLALNAIDSPALQKEVHQAVNAQDAMMRFGQNKDEASANTFLTALERLGKDKLPYVAGMPQLREAAKQALPKVNMGPDRAQTLELLGLHGRDLQS